jgi:hypothetical protein
LPRAQISGSKPHNRIPSPATYSLASSQINKSTNGDKRLNMATVLGGYSVVANICLVRLFSAGRFLKTAEVDSG